MFLTRLTRLFTRVIDPDDHGAAIMLLRGMLRGPAFAFGVAAALRDRGYARGVLRSTRLPVKVISVGGITVGGAGKTPVVRYLARRLADAGHRVAILSRGYGHARPGGAVVSDGTKILLSPREAGDEPYLLASSLPGIPVVAGADRVEAGRLALQAFDASVLVLDDAFQHRRLARDIDVVVLDGTSPTGNGRFLPAGPLREPLYALRRADTIILTRIDQGDRVQALCTRIRAIAPGMPIVESVYRPVRLRRLADGAPLPLTRLRGRRVMALSGIANPVSFERTVRQLDAIIVRPFRFPDHHSFSAPELHDVNTAAKQARAHWIVTTEKDAARIPETIDRSRIVAVDIEVGIVKGETAFMAACGVSGTG